MAYFGEVIIKNVKLSKKGTDGDQKKYKFEWKT